MINYKAERDTLIDDLTWYRAKVSRLERDNRFLLSRKNNLFNSWRDENKRSVTLSKRLEQLERENGDLKQENARLTRLTHKLTNHRIMWDNLKDWRRDMLEIDKNDTQLIGLGLVMDELEHNWLYGEDK